MTYTIGQFVINFGFCAKIVDIREDGLLVVHNVRIGKWLADPDKCTPYEG